MRLVRARGSSGRLQRESFFQNYGCANCVVRFPQPSARNIAPEFCVSRLVARCKVSPHFALRCAGSAIILQHSPENCSQKPPETENSLAEFRFWADLESTTAGGRIESDASIGDRVMKMKRSLRRRSAVRELLLNFELRPFCDEPQPVSAGWLALARPGVAYSPIHLTAAPLLPGERR